MGRRSRQSWGGGGDVVMLSAVVLVVLAAVLLREADAQLCPACECPVAYKPVCGKTTDGSGKVRLRGFPSRCIMECNNQCRKTQFEFLKRGRCGSKTPKPSRDQAVNSVMDKGQPVDNTTAPNLKILSVPPA